MAGAQAIIEKVDNMVEIKSMHGCGHVAVYKSLRWATEDTLKSHALGAKCPDCLKREALDRINLEAKKEQIAKSWIEKHGLGELNCTIDSSMTYGSDVEIRIFLKVI